MSEETDTIETTEQPTAIGDNSLISAILTQRVEETPTKLVPEVESPDPSLTETGEAEFIEVIEEKKAAPEPDYTEYEAEPAPIQKKEEPKSILSPVETEEDPEEAERKWRWSWSLPQAMALRLIRHLNPGYKVKVVLE